MVGETKHQTPTCHCQMKRGILSLQLRPDAILHWARTDMHDWFYTKGMSLINVLMRERMISLVLRQLSSENGGRMVNASATMRACPSGLRDTGRRCFSSHCFRCSFLCPSSSWLKVLLQAGRNRRSNSLLTSVSTFSDRTVTSLTAAPGRSLRDIEAKSLESGWVDLRSTILSETGSTVKTKPSCSWPSSVVTWTSLWTRPIHCCGSLVKMGWRSSVVLDDILLVINQKERRKQRWNLFALSVYTTVKQSLSCIYIVCQQEVFQVLLANGKCFTVTNLKERLICDKNNEVS